MYVMRRRTDWVRDKLTAGLRPRKTSVASLSFRPSVYQLPPSTSQILHLTCCSPPVSSQHPLPFSPESIDPELP